LFADSINNSGTQKYSEFDRSSSCGGGASFPIEESGASFENEEGELEELEDEDEDDSNLSSGKSPKPKRITKDRSIKEVLDLISRWRSLYDKKANSKASSSPNGGKQMTLQDAAVYINVPKKTLDDYFLIIKKAKALNFDFNANMGERFGIVRSFVKKAKAKSNKKEVAYGCDDAFAPKKKMNGASKKISK
jgi:hypothetical protein